jgi:hypothetical protein
VCARWATRAGPPYGAQTPALHVKPATQSALLAQLVLQALTPQTYGAHDETVPGLQLPPPSQVPVPDCMPPVQVGTAQTVNVDAYWQEPPEVLQPTAPHTPDVLGHDETQHTPPTQKPLVHCVLLAQEAPLLARVVVVVEPVVMVVDVVDVGGSVVVVLASTISGAHRIFGTLGNTCRSPN